MQTKVFKNNKEKWEIGSENLEIFWSSQKAFRLQRDFTDAYTQCVITTAADMSQTEKEIHKDNINDIGKMYTIQWTHREGSMEIYRCPVTRAEDTGIKQISLGAIPKLPSSYQLPKQLSSHEIFIEIEISQDNQATYPISNYIKEKHYQPYYYPYDEMNTTYNMPYRRQNAINLYTFPFSHSLMQTLNLLLDFPEVIKENMAQFIAHHDAKENDKTFYHACFESPSPEDTDAWKNEMLQKQQDITKLKSEELTVSSMPVAAVKEDSEENHQAFDRASFQPVFPNVTPVQPNNTAGLNNSTPTPF